MLIPTVVAGRRTRDKLEVSVSRCVFAVRACQKTAIREGWVREAAAGLGGFEREGILKRLLTHSCHLSVQLLPNGWLLRLMKT